MDQEGVGKLRIPRAKLKRTGGMDVSGPDDVGLSGRGTKVTAQTATSSAHRHRK